jgi:hypothetical protein
MKFLPHRAAYVCLNTVVRSTTFRRKRRARPDSLDSPLARRPAKKLTHSRRERFFAADALPGYSLSGFLTVSSMRRAFPVSARMQTLDIPSSFHSACNEKLVRERFQPRSTSCTREARPLGTVRGRRSHVDLSGLDGDRRRSLARDEIKGRRE